MHCLYETRSYSVCCTRCTLSNIGGHPHSSMQAAGCMPACCWLLAAVVGWLFPHRGVCAHLMWATILVVPAAGAALLMELDRYACGQVAPSRAGVAAGVQLGTQWSRQSSWSMYLWLCMLSHVVSGRSVLLLVLLQCSLLPLAMASANSILLIRP